MNSIILLGYVFPLPEYGCPRGSEECKTTGRLYFSQNCIIGVNSTDEVRSIF